MALLLLLPLFLLTGAPAQAATSAEAVARLVSAGELDKARRRSTFKDGLSALAPNADGTGDLRQPRAP